MALQKIEACLRQAGNEFVRVSNEACLMAFGMDVQELAKQIHKVALEVFVFVISTILFLANSSIFAIGALYGVVNSENMREMLESIQDVWERQEFGSRALITLAALFAWPIAIAAAAFFVGGHIGSKLYHEANHGRLDPSAFDLPQPEAQMPL